MDLEKALALTDALVFAKLGSHLSDLQQAMLRESWSWQRQSYDKIADTYGYSSTYLKHDVGPKLWRLLSDVLGEKVNKTSFRAAIERRLQAESVTLQVAQSVAPEQPPSTPSEDLTLSISQQTAKPSRHDWGESVEVSFFYGRDLELAQLQQWIIKDRCRLIALLGMGGMGKTSLSVKLGQQLQDQFEWVIWRSLRNAPPIQELLADVLHVLSPQQTADVPNSLGGKLSQVLQKLRSHRCLLILDNVETILADSDLPSKRGLAHSLSSYREGCEGYGELFKQIGETLHQSCLVLTSRETPQEVKLLEAAMLPVRSLQLSGLDQTNGRKLLELKGAFQASNDEWAALIDGYSGNPLALKIISTTIQNLFDGSISEFLTQKTFVFGNIRSLIEQQFERLSEIEKAVIYWLSIYREPVPFANIRSDFFPAIAPQQLVDALELLFQRSLIEKNAAGFSLQPVVMEYVTDRFVAQICHELRAGLQLSLSQKNLFKTHPLLQAQAKDYIRDTQIRLVLKPVIEQLQAELGSETVIDQLLTQLLGDLRGKSSLEIGYAGGNLINVLCQQRSLLKGYDFSQLTIWQADLRRVQLHDVNFAESDLSRSVFAETLGIVFGVAFSPDGSLLATGDAEGGLRLWQVATGKPLLNLTGHIGWVWSVAFSADGHLLASCSSDKTIRLWNVSTGECLKILEGHTSSVWSVAFSADGKTLASGGDESIIRLWDVQTGSCRETLLGHTGRILSVAFADNQRLASGSDDNTIRLWDISTKHCQTICSDHGDRVWSVAFSPDGSLLASGSADRTIRIWSAHTGECLKTLNDHTDRIRSVMFSPDAQTVVSSSDDQTVRIWQVNTGKCLSILHGHINSVFSVAYSADGQTIASGSTDQTVRVWSATTGRCIRTLKGYTNSVFSVVYSADGQTIASGSTDQTVRVWSVTTGKCLKTLQGHSGWVTSVAFHPEGNLLASSSADQTVKLWDVSTGRCLKTLQGHSNWVQSVAFSPNGEMLASGGDDRLIRLWSVKTGQCLNVLQGHLGWIWAIAVSPDGETLASSSEDHTIRLWSVSTGQCFRILQHHTSRIKSIAFSSNGQLLGSASDDETVRIWSVDTGQCLHTLNGHTNNAWSVSFSPDDKVLASGSLDQTVKLWDVSSGVCLKTLPILTHSVRSTIAFNLTQQTGYTLATGTHSGTVQIWDTETGQCLKTLIPDRPYQGTNIAGVTGITAAQKAALQALGARD